MVATALLILSEGTEEIEAVTLIDVLRRAGVNVTVGGLQGSGLVQCANKTQIKPDIALRDVSNILFDVVIMPGGMGGSTAMAESPLMGSILKAHANANRYIAAICAAPIGLQSHGIWHGKKLTSYPGFEGQLKSFQYCQDRVVVDDHLVTSRGPGTSFALAIKLVELLVSKDKAQALTQGLLLNL